MAGFSEIEPGAVSVRLMRQEDVAQVTEIDREAFLTEWPTPDYHRELKNPLAHYIVASVGTGRDADPEIKPEKGFSSVVLKMGRSFGRRFRDGGPSSSPTERILGFAGFWMMADEAHIISIAVRQQHQGKGIGELLLLSLIEMATGLNASIVNLEVRASNIAAQGLYSKCGFAGVGIRRGYYSDNKEDGILMSLGDVASSYVQQRLQRLKETHSQRWGIPNHQVAR